MKSVKPKGTWHATGGELYEDKSVFARWIFYKRLDYALSMGDIQNNMIVADIGCGEGYFLLSLGKAAKVIVGIEKGDRGGLRLKQANKFLTEELLEDRSKVTLINADACALPLQTASCDRIFMLDVLEHMPYELGILCLQEVKRVLKPAGIFICTLPIEKGLNLLMRTVVRKILGVPQPKHYSLSDLLVAALLNRSIGPHDQHAGYDYIIHLHQIEKIFMNSQRKFIPLPWVGSLNPLVIIKAVS